jgi:2-succinyl-5-enolpyruvyl-6-hydroxy-3-cyclohexene-1-carboxylate synthase
VEVVAIGSGSRSTALALAFADDDRFRCTSHVDERSAAFFALGAARATGRPAAVVTTSGTAVANLLPAVVEARYAGVPLVCVTADRPPELHDVGATQTIDQIGLLPPVLWDADVYAFDAEARDYASSVGSQATALASGPPPGPVHVNVRFREPLTPSAAARRDTPPMFPAAHRRAGVPKPDERTVEAVAERVREESRGLVYVGHLEGEHPELGSAIESFARRSGYPVVIEATSGLRGAMEGDVLVDACEALVRHEGFAGTYRPDLVIRVGRPPLTRAVGEWLASLDAVQIVVSPSLPWPDPSRDATEVLTADPVATFSALSTALADAPPEPDWMKSWQTASRAAREALDTYVDEGTELFEGTVARVVTKVLPPGGMCYVGTSLPIRALDTFTPADRPLRALANRGASGIDGTVSGALGAAAATGRPVMAMLGDLALLHDLGALLTIARHRTALVIVVIDNGGGGIFEFLPQASTLERDEFEDLFVAAHRVDLLHAAELFSTGFAAARDAEAIERSLEWAFTARTPQLIRVPVDREASVRAHRDALARAHAAIDAVGS